MFEGLQQREYDPVTFAEPLASGSFTDMFVAAERQQRLVNNSFAADQSREELYERRIAAVLAATGTKLENPERGGYSLTERELRRLTREAGGPINPMEHRRSLFEQKLADLRAAHPDKAEALTFGDLEAEGREIAKAAEIEGSRDNAANPIVSFAASVAGGIWGHRRDPLFVGSLFAGPVSATGKTALARIVDSGMRQGLYNAGITAMEQPSVQAWRNEIGVKSGVEPALENVGMAFLFGMIPGMAFRGVHELVTARPAMERVLRGSPEPGDVETVTKALGDNLSPFEQAMLRAGDDMVTADRTIIPAAMKDVPPELHHDLTAAALRRADDPAAPSPEAVAAVRESNELTDPALQARIAEANPLDLHEARVAADDALDDFGRAQGMAVTRDQIGEEQAVRIATASSYVEAAAEAKPARGDPLGKVPFTREDGSPTLLTPSAAAKIGEREAELGMLIRSCK